MPAGTVRTRVHDGRDPWLNDDAAAVVAATHAENGGDFQINYDHQPGPAAGWVKRVFERDGALWATVDWTERAAAAYRAKEYRYISPEFMFEPDTRRVTLITGAALTNDPALYMRAIANANRGTETEMDLAKLRKALGLADAATEAEILAAAEAAAAGASGLAEVGTALGLSGEVTGETVTAALTAQRTGVAAIATAAGLAEGATLPEIATAVTAAKASAGSADPGAFVPRADFDRLAARFADMETATTEEKAVAAVDAAIQAGKFAPATREHHLKHAKANLEDFQALAAATPALLPAGRVAPAGSPEGGDVLTADEKAVCRSMGIAEEDYVKSRKALAAAGEEV